MLKLQEIARRYVAQGFSVIPILPEQKKPAQSWMEFNDRKAEQHEIQDWFTKKKTNIGIVTGPISKIVAIDIDKPELYSEFIKEYPTHRIQRTASGGYHLLYRYTGTDIGNSISRLSNGIDVRGNHGYIVTYPSTIRLVNGTLGEYHWAEEGDILPLPTSLHDLIIKELQTYKVETLNDDAKDLWVQVLTNGFTERQHNEQIYDLARYLARMKMSDAAIFTTLNALNLQDKTPLPQNEFTATVKSGINYEKTRLQSKQETQQIETEELGVRLARTRNFKREWLIQDWLLKNSIMVLTAPPEQYKTWIALEAAVQLALGAQSTGFLGGTWRGPDEPQNVLIIQQEDNEDLVIERMRAIIYSKIADETQRPNWENVAAKLPIWFPKDDLLSFDDKESMKNLEDRIIKYKINFVVIDPLYSLASSDDFFASMAKKMLEIKRLRNKYGVTFLFVHHNKKGTTGLADIDDLEREGMYGSQLLNGAFEGMWLVNTLKNKKTRIIGRTGKSFLSETRKEKWVIDFNIDTETTLVEDKIVMNDAYVVSLSRPEGMELTEDQEALRDAMIRLGQGTKSGVIMEARNGKQPTSKWKSAFDYLVECKIFIEVPGGKHGGEYKMGDVF